MESVALESVAQESVALEYVALESVTLESVALESVARYVSSSERTCSSTMRLEVKERESVYMTAEPMLTRMTGTMTALP